MGLFTPGKSTSYPRQWAEMSLDFKLMFVWHGCMMLLLVTGERFTARQELAFAAILMVVLISIAMRHRRTRNWHWQGVETKQTLQAAGGLVLTIIFLYAASPYFSPGDPRLFPWYLAGFGIGAINFLQGLRLVRLAESQFAADCQDATPKTRPAPSSPPEPDEPVWHRQVRGILTIVFFLLWSDFCVLFYLSGKAFREGSPAPTATHTDPMTEHGRTVYITHAQKVLNDRLMLVYAIGLPSVIIVSFILHNFVGVRIFKTAPSRWQRLGPISSGDKS